MICTACYKMTFKTIKDILFIYQNQIFAVLIPIIFLPLPIVCNGDEKALCAYVLLWMSFYYILQVIPLGITALLPILLFPLLGVLSSKDTAEAYASEGLWVQFGTIICGAAFEQVGLHRRCAFTVLKAVGPKPTRLLWSFGWISFFISMLTTNIAAAMAILTIVNALIAASETVAEGIDDKNDIELVETPENSEAKEVKDEIKSYENENGRPAVQQDNIQSDTLNSIGIQHTVSSDKLMVYMDSVVEIDIPISEDIKSYNLQKVKENNSQVIGYAIGMAVKFGCLLGGMASPMGGASNILIMELISNCFEDTEKPSPLTFGTWVVAMVPVAAVTLTILLLFAQLYYFGTRSFMCCKEENMSSEMNNINAVKKWIEQQYESMGKLCYQEIVLILMFTLLVLLWILLDPGLFPGWADLPIFKEGYIGATVPTFLIAIPLFILPTKPPVCLNYDQHTTDISTMPTIMNWHTMKSKVPWQLPLLFGSGLAAAKGASASGLEDWLGEQFEKLSHLDPDTLVFIFCIIAAFATEILSTTLMLNIFIPVMCTLSVKVGKNPLHFALPVAFSINTNFMMPNQPVNTLCLDYKKTTVLQLMATGAVADVLFVCVITFSCLTWFVPLFNLNDVPDFIEFNTTTIQPVDLGVL